MEEKNRGKETPRTEEDLRAHTIGELKPLTAPVMLSDYDPEWPVRFEREAARIRDLLGERVKLLEHAGSTSVPGLTAKPILDMVLAVANSSDEPSYVPALEQGGYVLRIREPNWFEHRMLKGTGQEFNLHVFSEGCTEIDQMLLFRDWLRANAEDRELYASKKREVVQRKWRFVQNYSDAKSEVVQQILARARAAACGSSQS
jgi:GrpB-like predicted nucleotidyltransferase (UPF0157 family)